MDSPEYVEALVAFYERRYHDALERARAAHLRLSWMYEARELEAGVYAAIGNEAQARGDRRAATEAYLKAQETYEAARGVGRSHPGILLGLCGLETARMQMELYSGTAAVDPHLRAGGLAACERALCLDPGNAEGHQAKAALLWRAGESEFRRGADPRETLARAIAASREALRLGLGDDETHYGTGVAHALTARYEALHGGDPTSRLDESIRAFEAGLRINPNSHNLLQALGVSYIILARHDAQAGRDPRALLAKARQFFERAVAAKPDFVISIASLGDCMETWPPTSWSTGGIQARTSRRRFASCSRPPRRIHDTCTTTRGSLASIS